MRIILFFLLILFSFVDGMEQPRVAILDHYTLSGESGGEVTFDGPMMRELVPGFAEKFHLGMKEAATGIIKIHNLDEAGLQVLKELLGALYPLHKEYEQQKKDIDIKAKNAIESIVYPEQQRQRETDERNTALQKFGVQKQEAFFNLAQKAKEALEKISNIGDYFLDIFNNLIVWQAAPVIEGALGKFAGDHIDFGDDEQYAQLKLLDPRAQLIYLVEVPFTIDTVLRAFEWFKELVTKPDIMTQEKNIPLVNFLAQKLSGFANQHIEAIIKRYPQFTELIKDPVLQPVADQLELLLKHNPDIAFERNFSVDNQGISTMIDLESAGFGVEHNGALYIFDKTNYAFKSNLTVGTLLVGGKLKIIGSYLPDKLVVYDTDNAVLYDLSSHRIVLNYVPLPQSSLNASISNVQILDENTLLVANIGSALRAVKVGKAPRRIDRLHNVAGSTVFDPAHILVHTLTGELILWNSLNNKIIQRWNLETMLGGYQKINAGQCMVYKFNDNFIPHFYLVDIFAKTINDLGMVDFKLVTPIGQRDIFVLTQDYFFGYNGYLWSISNRTFEPFIKTPLSSIIALNHNRVAYVAKNSTQIVIKFVPQASTREEIFAEIKKHIEEQSAQPAQPQKRAASPTLEERPIPAAAQGARTEVPEVKRKRPENPNK